MNRKIGSTLLIALLLLSTGLMLATLVVPQATANPGRSAWLKIVTSAWKGVTCVDLASYDDIATGFKDDAVGITTPMCPRGVGFADRFNVTNLEAYVEVYGIKPNLEGYHLQGAFEPNATGFVKIDWTVDDNWGLLIEVKAKSYYGERIGEGDPFSGIIMYALAIPPRSMSVLGKERFINLTRGVNLLSTVPVNKRSVYFANGTALDMLANPVGNWTVNDDGLLDQHWGATKKDYYFDFDLPRAGLGSGPFDILNGTSVDLKSFSDVFGKETDEGLPVNAWIARAAKMFKVFHVHSWYSTKDALAFAQIKIYDLDHTSASSESSLIQAAVTGDDGQSRYTREVYPSDALDYRGFWENHLVPIPLQIFNLENETVFHGGIWEPEAIAGSIPTGQSLGVDDDHDGVIDEEIYDGFDNDGDGEVDEDCFLIPAAANQIGAAKLNATVRVWWETVVVNQTIYYGKEYNGTGVWNVDELTGKRVPDFWGPLSMVMNNTVTVSTFGNSFRHAFTLNIPTDTAGPFDLDGEGAPGDDYVRAAFEDDELVCFLDGELKAPKGEGTLSCYGNVLVEIDYDEAGFATADNRFYVWVEGSAPVKVLLDPDDYDVDIFTTNPVILTGSLENADLDNLGDADDKITMEFKVVLDLDADFDPHTSTLLHVDLDASLDDIDWDAEDEVLENVVIDIDSDGKVEATIDTGIAEYALDGSLPLGDEFEITKTISILKTETVDYDGDEDSDDTLVFDSTVTCTLTGLIDETGGSTYGLFLCKGTADITASLTSPATGWDSNYDSGSFPVNGAGVGKVHFDSDTLAVGFSVGAALRGQTWKDMLGDDTDVEMARIWWDGDDPSDPFVAAFDSVTAGTYNPTTHRLELTAGKILLDSDGDADAEVADISGQALQPVADEHDVDDVQGSASLADVALNARVMASGIWIGREVKYNYTSNNFINATVFYAKFCVQDADLEIQHPEVGDKLVSAPVSINLKTSGDEAYYMTKNLLSTDNSGCTDDPHKYRGYLDQFSDFARFPNATMWTSLKWFAIGFDWIPDKGVIGVYEPDEDGNGIPDWFDVRGLKSFWINFGDDVWLYGAWAYLPADARNYEDIPEGPNLRDAKGPRYIGDEDVKEIDHFAGNWSKMVADVEYANTLTLKDDKAYKGFDVQIKWKGGARNNYPGNEKLVESIRVENPYAIATLYDYVKEDLFGEWVFPSTELANNKLLAKIHEAEKLTIEQRYLCFFEWAAHIDLNGDGDTNDKVKIEEARIGRDLTGDLDTDDTVTIDESKTGVDFNGDDDTEDLICVWLGRSGMEVWNNVHFDTEGRITGFDSYSPDVAIDETATAVDLDGDKEIKAHETWRVDLDGDGDTTDTNVIMPFPFDESGIGVDINGDDDTGDTFQVQEGVFISEAKAGIDLNSNHIATDLLGLITISNPRRRTLEIMGSIGFDLTDFDPTTGTYTVRIYFDAPGTMNIVEDPTDLWAEYGNITYIEIVDGLVTLKKHDIPYKTLKGSFHVTFSAGQGQVDIEADGSDDYTTVDEVTIYNGPMEVEIWPGQPGSGTIRILASVYDADITIYPNNLAAVTFTDYSGALLIKGPPGLVSSLSGIFTTPGDLGGELEITSGVPPEVYSGNLFGTGVVDGLITFTDLGVEAASAFMHLDFDTATLTIEGRGEAYEDVYGWIDGFSDGIIDNVNIYTGDFKGSISISFGESVLTAEGEGTLSCSGVALGSTASCTLEISFQGDVTGTDYPGPASGTLTVTGIEFDLDTETTYFLSLSESEEASIHTGDPYGDPWYDWWINTMKGINFDYVKKRGFPSIHWGGPDVSVWSGAYSLTLPQPSKLKFMAGFVHGFGGSPLLIGTSMEASIYKGSFDAIYDGVGPIYVVGSTGDLTFTVVDDYKDFDVLSFVVPLPDYSKDDCGGVTEGCQIPAVLGNDDYEFGGYDDFALTGTGIVYIMANVHDISFYVTDNLGNPLPSGDTEVDLILPNGEIVKRTPAPPEQADQEIGSLAWSYKWFGEGNVTYFQLPGAEGPYGVTVLYAGTEVYDNRDEIDVLYKTEFIELVVKVFKIKLLFLDCQDNLIPNLWFKYTLPSGRTDWDHASDEGDYDFPYMAGGTLTIHNAWWKGVNITIIKATYPNGTELPLTATGELKLNLDEGVDAPVKIKVAIKDLIFYTWNFEGDVKIPRLNITLTWMGTPKPWSTEKIYWLETLDPSGDRWDSNEDCGPSPWCYRNDYNTSVTVHSLYFKYNVTVFFQKLSEANDLEEYEAKYVFYKMPPTWYNITVTTQPNKYLYGEQPWKTWSEVNNPFGFKSDATTAAATPATSKWPGRVDIPVPYEQKIMWKWSEDYEDTIPEIVHSPAAYVNDRVVLRIFGTMDGTPVTPENFPDRWEAWNPGLVGNLTALVCEEEVNLYTWAHDFYKRVVDGKERVGDAEFRVRNDNSQDMYYYDLEEGKWVGATHTSKWTEDIMDLSRMMKGSHYTSTIWWNGSYILHSLYFETNSTYNYDKGDYEPFLVDKFYNKSVDPNEVAPILNFTLVGTEKLWRTSRRFPLWVDRITGTEWQDWYDAWFLVYELPSADDEYKVEIGANGKKGVLPIPIPVSFVKLGAFAKGGEPLEGAVVEQWILHTDADAAQDISPTIDKVWLVDAATGGLLFNYTGPGRILVDVPFKYIGSDCETSAYARPDFVVVWEEKLAETEPEVYEHTRWDRIYLAVIDADADVETLATNMVKVYVDLDNLLFLQLPPKPAKLTIKDYKIPLPKPTGAACTTEIMQDKTADAFANIVLLANPGLTPAQVDTIKVTVKGFLTDVTSPNALDSWEESDLESTLNALGVDTTEIDDGELVVLVNMLKASFEDNCYITSDEATSIDAAADAAFGDKAYDAMLVAKYAAPTLPVTHPGTINFAISMDKLYPLIDSDCKVDQNIAEEANEKAWMITSCDVPVTGMPYDTYMGGVPSWKDMTVCPVATCTSCHELVSLQNDPWSTKKGILSYGRWVTEADGYIDSFKDLGADDPRYGALVLPTAGWLNETFNDWQGETEDEFHYQWNIVWKSAVVYSDDAVLDKTGYTAGYSEVYSPTFYFALSNSTKAPVKNLNVWIYYMNVSEWWWDFTAKAQKLLKFKEIYPDGKFPYGSTGNSPQDYEKCEDSVIPCELRVTIASEKWPDGKKTFELIPGPRFMNTTWKYVFSANNSDISWLDELVATQFVLNNETFGDDGLKVKSKTAIDVPIMLNAARWVVFEVATWRDEGGVPTAYPIPDYVVKYCIRNLDAGIVAAEGAAVTDKEGKVVLKSDPSDPTKVFWAGMKVRYRVEPPLGQIPEAKTWAGDYADDYWKAWLTLREVDYIDKKADYKAPAEKPIMTGAFYPDEEPTHFAIQEIKTWWEPAISFPLGKYQCYGLCVHEYRSKPFVIWVDYTAVTVKVTDFNGRPLEGALVLLWDKASAKIAAWHYTAGKEWRVEEEEPGTRPIELSEFKVWHGLDPATDTVKVPFQTEARTLGGVGISGIMNVTVGPVAYDGNDDDIIDTSLPHRGIPGKSDTSYVTYIVRAYWLVDDKSPSDATGELKAVWPFFHPDSEKYGAPAKAQKVYDSEEDEVTWKVMLPRYVAGAADRVGMVKPFPESLYIPTDEAPTGSLVKEHRDVNAAVFDLKMRFSYKVGGESKPLGDLAKDLEVTFIKAYSTLTFKGKDVIDLKMLPRGTYTVIAKWKGVEVARRTLDLSDVNVGTVTADIPLAMTDVSFQVVDMLGRPLPDAKVSVAPDTYGGFSNVGGVITIRAIVTTQVYEFTLSWASPVYGTEADATVADTPEGLAARKTITLPVADVTVNVVDLKGEPIAGAEVTFGGVAKTTDADGKAIFEQVPLEKGGAGISYDITVKREGYTAFTGSETVSRSKTSITVIGELFTLRVRVVGAAGQGLPYAKVVVKRAGAEIGTYTTDEGGFLELSKMALSDYDVEAEWKGFRGSATVTKDDLKAGRAVEISLPPYTEIAGVPLTFATFLALIIGFILLVIVLVVILSEYVRWRGRRLGIYPPPPKK